MFFYQIIETNTYKISSQSEFNKKFSLNLNGYDKLTYKVSFSPDKRMKILNHLNIV